LLPGFLSLKPRSFLYIPRRPDTQLRAWRFVTNLSMVEAKDSACARYAATRLEEIVAMERDIAYAYYLESKVLRRRRIDDM
jgi:hypothetical protein